LVERGAEPRDALVVLEVKRNKRGAAAGRADRIVELLQAADRARECDHVRARARERKRRRIADAARGAGDERDLAGEGTWHHLCSCLAVVELVVIALDRSCLELI